MKACTRCQVVTDQFHRHPNTRDGLTSWCKRCMNEGRDKKRKKEKNREHYERNRDLYKKRSAERYERIQSILREAKRAPCVDCGVQLPPECMDFDHVHGEKLFTVGAWNSSPLPDGKQQEDAIREEIAKCEVRCPNCHRLRHHNSKILSHPRGND